MVFWGFQGADNWNIGWYDIITDMFDGLLPIVPYASVDISTFPLILTFIVFFFHLQFLN